jgi:hypothetical protein
VLNRNGLVFVVFIEVHMLPHIHATSLQCNVECVYLSVKIICQVKLKIWNLVYAAPLHCLFTDTYLNLIVVLMSGVRSWVNRLYGWYCCFFNCLVYRIRESFVGSMFLLKCVPVYCYLMCHKIKSMTICWSRVVVQNRVYLMSKISNWTEAWHSCQNCSLFI